MHATLALSRTPVLLSGVLLLLLTGTAFGKPPTKKQIDQTLLTVDTADMAPVKEAEDALHAGGQHEAQVATELANARLDQAAAKAWVDASAAVGKALESSRKAADAANRAAELEDLAGRIARAGKTSEWRSARLDAAKKGVALQQARLAWAKAENARLKLALDLVRLQTYVKAIKNDVEAANEGNAEAGRVQTKEAKQARIANKERGKAEKAERALSDATLRAEALDPSR